MKKRRIQKKDKNTPEIEKVNEIIIDDVDWKTLLENSQRAFKEFASNMPMVGSLMSIRELGILNATQKLEDEAYKLKKERNKLFETLTQLNNELEKNKHDNLRLADEKAKMESALEKFKRVNEALNKKSNLGHLITQVNDSAKQKLFESQKFRDLFLSTKNCHSYVLSIDIRRSTELMLKAKSPEKFEEFIINLCRKLSNVILNNYGVFDKFTGDGVLAFFPTFFSGSDAGLLVLKSALECHSVFFEHYNSNRACFISVLKEIGLGIGIDYGPTYLVNMDNAFTVIGTPVVYACRMSSAPAGMTYLNQGAYEEIFHSYQNFFNFVETEINIKNEGTTVAYCVYSNGSDIAPNKPAWDQ